MRNKMKVYAFITMTAVILSAQTGFAEPSEAALGIFEALLDEDSDYSEMKAMYQEYYPECVFEEKLEDQGFTIAINGDEDLAGSWTFTEEEGYLSTALSEEDYTGLAMAIYLVDAVGEYYDMNSTLLHGYVNGLSMHEIENDNFTITDDEDTGETQIRINTAGPYDMKELDQMVIDRTVLENGDLSEDYISISANIGKVMTICNGSKEDLTILLGEYGELDDLAYQSLKNIVEILQPDGWEEFGKNYTELADAEEAGYTVTLNVDEETVEEIIDDGDDEYSYAVIRFGE